MQTSTIVIAILVLGTIAYRLGRRRSLAVAGGPRGIKNLHSLPGYYGLLTAIWCALPALGVLGAWHFVDQRVIAIYFDKNRLVQRLANYGLQDGKIFDFISRTTPTAGSDATFISALFDAVSHAHIGLPF